MDDDRLRDALHRLADRAGEPDASPTRLMRQARLRVVRNVSVAVLAVVAITTLGVAAYGQFTHPITTRPAFTPRSPTPSESPTEPPALQGEIAFLSNRGPGWGQRVFVLRGLAHPRQVTTTQGYSSRVSWAPDGHFVVLDRELSEGHGSLVIVDVRTGKERVLLSDRPTTTPLDPQGPSWSPDGKKIAFESGAGDIYVIHPDGTGLERILDPPGRCGDLYPAWAPDSDQIAFAGGCRNGGIFVVSLAGGRPRRITSDRRDLEPSWSPDGSEIAFSRFRTLRPVLMPNGNPNESSRGGSNIFVVNVATQNLARLTDATDSYSPSWSPDGSQIVFGSNRRGTQDIWVMGSDGSDQRPLTSDPAIDFAPTWLAP